MKEAFKNHTKEVLTTYAKEEIIIDALLNYECFYNDDDLDRAIESVRHFNITEEEVLKVFKVQLKIFNETDDEDIFFNNIRRISKKTS